VQIFGKIFVHNFCSVFSLFYDISSEGKNIIQLELRLGKRSLRKTHKQIWENTTNYKKRCPPVLLK